MSKVQRPRRNRRSENIRQLVAETELNVEALVMPLFVTEEKDKSEQIRTMPGQFRWGQKNVLEQIKKAQNLGIQSFAFFPVINENEKDSHASQAINAKHWFLQFLSKAKDENPESVLITDIALDPFSSDGHDGLVKNGIVLNDETVEILAEMALLHAKTGADFVAPSDMMDGRVQAIRKKMDSAGFQDTGILAYSAKYASSFYGPFRDALSSAPKKGDKKTYQMDYRNSREALREVRLDIEEGADIVMVKPALSYLDIIQKIRRAVSVPVAAYNVSGEYAMVKAAAAAGSLDEEKAVLEILSSIKRAGADIVLSYHAMDAAKWLKKII
jgi:porphobilinogen synthase